MCFGKGLTEIKMTRKNRGHIAEQDMGQYHLIAFLQPPNLFATDFFI